MGKIKRLVALLTTADGKKILLGIISEVQGITAEKHNRIHALLVKKGIPLNKMATCIFYITSVNTGELNGIIKTREILICPGERDSSGYDYFQFWVISPN